MLLVYVVLISSAGWMLATTPQGFIPAQDRGYVIVAVQLPGAASLERTTEVVRKIENIALGIPGVVRVPALAGFSGATHTQSGNSAALFPGSHGRLNHRGTAQAAGQHRGGFHHRDSAACDSGHWHRGRIHHAH